MFPTEEFLTNHKIWIDLLTAIGTVGATIIALVVTVGTWRRSRLEQLAGVTLTNPSNDGTVYLENNTRVEITVSVEKNNMLNPDSQDLVSSRTYQRILKLESIQKNSGWQKPLDEIILSPGQRLPIHLADIAAENTYVALAGLKITTDRKTMFSVFRFAGQKAKEDEILSGITHPHLAWVLVFQRSADDYSGN